MKISVREQRRYNNLVNVGVFLAFTALSAIIFSFFSPIVISRASELQTNFDAVVNPVASVSLDANSIVFNITPTSSGVFQSKSVVATVNTNSTGGYELYFSSENDATDMVNADVADVISSTFDGAVAGNSMPANSWGFSVDNETFKKIPTASVPAQLRYVDDVPDASEKETTVYIGTKINDAIAAGTYLKTVKVSVLAHESAVPFDGITRMQDMTPEICANASNGELTTLRDSRDAKTYTVRKLTDGRCWMTENLAITDKTITSVDSNLPSGETYTIPASDTANFTTAQNTSAAYHDADYGGYYNFYTATAGWGTDSVTSGNSTKSICPKGWTLPTSAEFGILYSKYNSPSLLKGIPKLVLAGRLYNGPVDLQGSNGDYWSSTVYSASNAYYLGFDDSEVRPAGNLEKYRGYSVRCIVPKTTSTQTMQTFDESTLPNVGDSATLEDERDGTMYNVKRLADGKVWMTRNLSIAGKTITSADSDLPSGETYTIPASGSNSKITSALNTSAAYVHTITGGYYNFYTATAGWGTSSVTSGDSPKSICPKGWRLPTGGEDGDFKTLTDNYSTSRALTGDPGLIYSGYTDNTGLGWGSIGYFWSSTANEDYERAYNLYFNTENLDPADDSKKVYGMAVRCIAKEKVPTMQGFDKTTLASVGDSVRLEDERDGNMYTVKKLADGNVWMTENLRLINKTISSTDSNLSSGETYTVPASNLSSFATDHNTNAAYLDSTYGGYYNFYTATAGWGTNSVTSGNSPKDICPKGWRLPIGGSRSSSEFQTLYNNYHSSALMQGTPGFVLSGYVYRSYVNGQGSEGHYWSSTVYNADYANDLYLSSDVTPTYNYYKYFGRSVRCVAR